MPYQHILYEKSHGVGMATLNRPGKLNALHFDLLNEFWSLLQSVRKETDVKVLVITGAGRYFSAGADLSILSSLSPSTFRLHQDIYWNRVFCEIEDLPKLTIAAINGPAIGGGLELALCCDLRYAAERATFRMPQIDFGLIPDAGGTMRLPWLMGLAKAKEFILSGDEMDAPSAQTNGILNRVFGNEDFHGQVRLIAEKMAQKSQRALGLGKQIINRGFTQRDVRSGLEAVSDVQSLLITSREYKEGIKEILKK